MDGSTLCTVFVDSNALLTACWLGDSRAVLVHYDGSVTGLTKDHKPYHEDEEKRIIASGGFVEGQRVNGVLAMSRSLGDVPLKRPNKAVSNEPSVTTRQLTPNDAFIVIASDGLFDVVSNNFVGRTCKKKGKAVSAAADLMYHARMQGTRDNTSVIVIRMDWSSGCSISSTDNNNNNN
jgi:protein phosphatase 1L